MLTSSTLLIPFCAWLLMGYFKSVWFRPEPRGIRALTSANTRTSPTRAAP